MAEHPLQKVVRHICKLAGGPATREASDQDLLGRYIRLDDGGAFEALVKRHGPMVRDLCRRLFTQDADADDAFQAVFLILARKARSIRKRQSLASWLHGVACRVAEKSKRDVARRHRLDQRRQPHPAAEDVGKEAAWRELCRVLDAELNCVGESYKAPLVLCYLQGRTRDEAAKQLGYSLRTLDRRLERGRQLMQHRLARRGYDLSGIMCVMGLAHTKASAVVPPQLLTATLKAASALTTPFAGGGGAISGTVAVLAERVMENMMIAQAVRSIAVFVGVVALAGVAALAVHGVGGQEGESKSEAVPVRPMSQQNQVKRVAAEATDRPRVDPYGSPLPTGVIARIGTDLGVVVRESGAQNGYLVFTPNGKSLVFSGSNNSAVRFCDPATGKEQRRISLPDEALYDFVLSPDGTKLITVPLAEGTVRVWDVATCKTIREISVPKGGCSEFAFSVDGTMLAGETGGFTRYWDVASWQETGKIATGPVRSVVVMSDGKTLVTAGKRNFITGWEGGIQWWDKATGKEIRRVDGKVARQRPTLSPDGKKMAAIIDPGTLHLWDAATGELITKLKMGNVRTKSTKSSSDTVWHWLCFAPNSQTLAFSPGLDDAEGEEKLISFVDTTMGREVRRWPAHEGGAFCFSPDGKKVAQQTSNLIEFFDSTTGQPLSQVPRPPRWIDGVRFTPDGKTLITSSLGGFTGRWDTTTGTLSTPLRTPPKEVDRPKGFWNHTDVLSADGTKSLLMDGKGVIHVWETATGKPFCRIDDSASYGLVISLDGKLIASRDKKRAVRIWDAETGQLVRRLVAPANRDFFGALGFSPTGDLLAISTAADADSDPNIITLWDVAAGKELVRLIGPGDEYLSDLLFSPDGKRIVSSHGGGRLSWVGQASPAMLARAKERYLRVWDVATGQELRHFPAAAGNLAIAHDGKTVAGDQGDAIVLWEVSSGKERGRFTGHRARISTFAFSADNKLLATGSDDQTALVWDVTGICPDGHWQVLDARPEEIETLWNDLQAGDGAKAYRAVWKMIAAGRQTVPFLAKVMRPVPGVDAQRLARLVPELNSEQFKVREQASKELRQLDDLAEPALRKSLAEKPPLEMRVRVEALLNKIVTRPLSSNELGQLRAVEVLEWAGTLEARQLLEKLAQGAPGARLTKEANASLSRLAKRKHTALVK